MLFLDVSVSVLSRSPYSLFLVSDYVLTTTPTSAVSLIFSLIQTFKDELILVVHSSQISSWRTSSHASIRFCGSAWPVAMKVGEGFFLWLPGLSWLAEQLVVTAAFLQCWVNVLTGELLKCDSGSVANGMQCFDKFVMRYIGNVWFKDNLKWPKGKKNSDFIYDQ